MSLRNTTWHHAKSDQTPEAGKRASVFPTRLGDPRLGNGGLGPAARRLADVLVRGAALLASRPVFFFQAEDGIRDYKVTGVQTCALPISSELIRRGEDYLKLMGRTVRHPGAVAGDTLRFSRSLRRVLTPPPAERSPLLRGGRDRKSVV